MEGPIKKILVKATYDMALRLRWEWFGYSNIGPVFSSSWSYATMQAARTRAKLVAKQLDVPVEIEKGR